MTRVTGRRLCEKHGQDKMCICTSTAVVAANEPWRLEAWFNEVRADADAAGLSIMDAIRKELSRGKGDDRN